MKIFKKHFRYTLAKRRKEMPSGLWSKCPRCSHLIFNKILQENLKVCPKCNYHFALTCYERVELLTDEQSFTELYSDMQSLDPLEFMGPKAYKDKLNEEIQATGLKEAVIVGEAKIDKKNIALGVTDSRFIMGSMGSVVGEKLTRIIEQAIEKKLPVVIVSGSGGGARMYEGLISLMQMAKTSGALALLKKQNLAFISVLT
ncbi:MAG: acetyl-CoA carboxylase carboxyltransferase subunit beta, partial [Candidatus Omnitrophica bacterium]|nr:acetyl-CoA carboxylase carboxyltransferase subunit beta [Candidatus Omnitrophota bacterium]